MDAETLRLNHDRYVETCRTHIHRQGLDDILERLEQNGFFEAPSSASYHLNEPGGLCLHSLNVFDTAVTIYKHVAEPAILGGTSPFTSEVSMESLAICTLFHDLCKVDMYHPSTKWKKSPEGRWVSYEGYDIHDNFPLGHGEKSVLLLYRYLHLTPNEMLAIRWHMGMFDMGENGTPQRFAYYEAMAKSPLVAIVHSADMLASNLLEKTTEH